ncbi:unnamed protein product [Schistosoma curassoni]|uniref:Uncharacterized protein n=1 Tax=Schistosoma curassoni TaxID=6186 RepID=A0A183K121_9TREM|nr:unnamed protein product [Schistosoma curassoni]
MFHSIWDSSVGCTSMSELMSTLGFESSTIYFKCHHVIHLTTES